MESNTEPTRPSLLIRVKNPQDQEAWAEFYEIYAPLLYRFARSRGLNHADAEDVKSQCCEALVRQIPTFDYERHQGGFKAWLYVMVKRRVIDRLRRRTEHQLDSAELRQLPAAETQDVWDLQWREHHLRYCVNSLRPTVRAETWAVFSLLIEEQLTVGEVATRLGITTNQVYKTRRRMLELIRRRIRELDPSADF